MLTLHRTINPPALHSTLTTLYHFRIQITKLITRKTLFMIFPQGQAFISKPEEVVFSDFDLGRLYRMKIQLTNVSYSINYCRLVGVSNNLKDFVKIDFNPPGSMSAGLTCNMTVTFLPMVWLIVSVILISCIAITVWWETLAIGEFGKGRQVKNLPI